MAAAATYQFHKGGPRKWNKAAVGVLSTLDQKEVAFRLKQLDQALVPGKYVSRDETMEHIAKDLNLDRKQQCALSWALAFLPNIDPQFAASQFARFRRDWFVPFAGMLGIYEW